MTVQSHTTKQSINLYNKDFFLWTQVTANQLKEKHFSKVDIVNLVEEIESMGRSEKRELKSRLIVLLMHLLKWKYQPGKRSDSWRNTIIEQRISLDLLLEDSPSLKPSLLEVFDSCYSKARFQSTNETGIQQDIFPNECPFTLEETLDSSYLPNV